jgi:hypothetical protein
VGPSDQPSTVCPKGVVPEARYASGFLSGKLSSISAFVVRCVSLPAIRTPTRVRALRLMLWGSMKSLTSKRSIVNRLLFDFASFMCLILLSIRSSHSNLSEIEC